MSSSTGLLTLLNSLVIYDASNLEHMKKVWIVCLCPFFLLYFTVFFISFCGKTNCVKAIREIWQTVGQNFLKFSCSFFPALTLYHNRAWNIQAWWFSNHLFKNRLKFLIWPFHHSVTTHARGPQTSRVWIMIFIPPGNTAGRLICNATMEYWSKRTRCTRCTRTRCTKDVS